MTDDELTLKSGAVLWEHTGGEYRPIGMVARLTDSGYVIPSDADPSPGICQFVSHDGAITDLGTGAPYFVQVDEAGTIPSVAGGFADLESIRQLACSLDANVYFDSQLQMFPINDATCRFCNRPIGRCAYGGMHP
jgi:hypothetical protein